MPKRWYLVKGRRVLTPDALRDCDKFLVSLRFSRRQRRCVLETWSAPEDLDEVLPPRKSQNDQREALRFAQEPLEERDEW